MFRPKFDALSWFAILLSLFTLILLSSYLYMLYAQFVSSRIINGSAWPAWPFPWPEPTWFLP